MIVSAKRYCDRALSVPGEFWLPMQLASSLRSVRCEVQEQHSESTCAMVAFLACDVRNVELPQCEPPWISSCAVGVWLSAPLAVTGRVGSTPLAAARKAAPE